MWLAGRPARLNICLNILFLFCSRLSASEGLLASNTNLASSLD